MNNFRTTVSPKPIDLNFDLQSKVMLVGSCFSDNIGSKLEKAYLRTKINSHGIVFNPLSVVKCLDDYLDKKQYTKSDLTSRGEEFVSLNHHGSFSANKAEDVLNKINAEIQEAYTFLKSADVVILTLGTAWAYFNRENDKLVANCHKLLSSFFEKKLVESPEIIASIQEVVSRLVKVNPNLKIILTVSPVRHWKDGVVENSLSKSHLLVAVNSLTKNNENVHYFPAFEIMMDDLRDYRFYNKDMLHPSALAVDYIWQVFQETFFNIRTQDKLRKIEKLAQVFVHRPKNKVKHEQAKDEATKSIKKIINS